ncbi:hypothetical protein ACEV60_21010 [Enterobacter ludwigii]|uniref:hypothetical protein n=1 Tax=Enterobacter ludwigii TaxID=299767 RepID=UPI003BEF2ECE
MKKLIGCMTLIVAGISSGAVTANGMPCGGGAVVFYGKTTNHNKAVEICNFAKEYNYIFGKIDGIPELNIYIPSSKIKIENLKGHNVGITTIMVPNGNVKYEVGYTQSEGTEGEYAINVWQKDKKIAAVKLDPETVINNIGNYANDDTNANAKEILKLTVLEKYSDVPAGRYYFWKYQLISSVDNLTINKITINNGHCLINEKKRVFMTKVREHNMLDRLNNGGRNQISEDHENPRTDWDLNTGGVYYFTVSSDIDYGKCRPREVLIETNKGISTFRWKN